MKSELFTVSTQKTLIEIQKESFSELKNQILEPRKHENPKITKYRKVYLDEVHNYDAISSKSELFDDVRDAQIIFCGDFHTLKRSQYTALKILRFLVEQQRKIFLALELVPVAKESIANKFVQGEMSEREFLENIQYEKIWGFSWDNYKPLFDFAKTTHTPILALNANNHNTDLHVRDQIAADRITECLETHPDAVIFCLYGDLHIAQKHIPEKVKKNLAKRKIKKTKTVTVFQNSDEIYWMLLDQNLAHQVDVVKVSNHAYCILSSTPWIKWQSYQSWIDENCSLLEEHEEDTFGYYQQLPDFFHEVQEFAEDILVFLNEKLPNFDDLQIHTALDTKVMDKIDRYFNSLREAPKKSIQNILDAEMIENRSVLIPDLSVIYLLDFSRNRAAEKSAQWVASKLSNDLCIYHKDFDEKEVFYRLVLWEAIGYFGSKIINPKRKCDQYEDFEKLLERTKNKKLTATLGDEKAVAEEVLKHHAYEMERMVARTSPPAPRKIYALKPKLFFLCARAEGRILGDQLYFKVISDLIPLKIVKHLFTCLSSKDSIQKTYWELAKQIKDPKTIDQMSKDELF